MENWVLTWSKLSQLSNLTVGSITDNTPGVYRLSYKADDGNYYVFYIGQAEDIKNKLLEHLSSSEPNTCIKNYLSTRDCYYRYSKITEKYIRNATERQAYKKYEPACNLVEPKGSEDVVVNLT